MRIGGEEAVEEDRDRDSDGAGEDNYNVHHHTVEVTKALYSSTPDTVSHLSSEDSEIGNEFRRDIRS